MPRRHVLLAAVLAPLLLGTGSGTARADFGARSAVIPRPLHPVDRVLEPFDLARPVVEKEVAAFFGAQRGALNPGPGAPVADAADETLMQPLYERFGDAGMGVVIADGWGHAVQGAAQLHAPDPLQDLQCDCFTGAWLGHQGLDTDRPISTPELMNVTEDLFPAYGGGAHGSGAQRKAAVLHGLTKGIGACLDTDTLLDP